MPSPSFRRCWRWLRSHLFTAAGVVAVVVVSIMFFSRRQSEWQEVYLPAAAHLWAGQDIYRAEDGYLYPPFMAWAALPFLALPAPVARFAWLVINLAALAALLRWGWRLAGGRAVEGDGACKRERLAALLGGMCGLFYVQNCLAHQQTDVLIAAALVGGCLLLARGRVFPAATALGLAAACKCTALLWAPYLLWRGRPAAAGWLLAVALGVNLLPDLVSSSPAGRPWLAEYAARYLGPITNREHVVGSWGSDPAYNQSLSGAGQRWCTTTWNWAAHDCTIDPRPPLLGPGLLRACVYGVQGLLLLAVLSICGRPLRAIPPEAGEPRQALECGIVLTLMLLFSPMSSKAHFGTLIVPGFCAARAAFVGRRRLVAGIVLGSAVLAVASNKDPLGERLYTLSLWYGVVTWETLLLLAGCLLVVRRGGECAGIQLPSPSPGGIEGNRAA